jgi:hypothetical protein
VTVQEALRFIDQEGVVLESARGPVPSLAERVTGRRIRGSWWGDPNADQIFALIRAVRRSPDLLVCRLVQGKITFVHRRLWPALVRMADRFPLDRLAAVKEIHTKQGKHAVRETAFPDWVPEDVLAAARQLDDETALAVLGESIQFATQKP